VPAAAAVTQQAVLRQAAVLRLASGGSQTAAAMQSSEHDLHPDVVYYKDRGQMAWRRSMSALLACMHMVCECKLDTARM
jgi:hypothetical protein